MELVRRLGCLPLALVQAGSYIREATSTNFSEYLEYYETEWNKLMKNDEELGIMGDMSNSYVRTTWSVTFQNLERKRPMVATALQLLAFFNRSNINHSTFKAEKKLRACQDGRIRQR